MPSCWTHAGTDSTQARLAALLCSTLVVCGSRQKPPVTSASDDAVALAEVAGPGRDLGPVIDDAANVRRRSVGATDPRIKAVVKDIAACDQGDTSCLQKVCGANYGPGNFVRVAWPLAPTASGSSASGLHPLGPVAELLLDESGVVLRLDTGSAVVVCSNGAGERGSLVP
ncbi:MAG: hypothetical protein JKY37_07530 [Nannocystaceae bacterium]|nr:hypothetical protein [Nannocystaceae bacterium]